MSKGDRNYYRRRADEELAAAERARVPAAATAHKILAERYSALLEEPAAPVQPDSLVSPTKP